MLYRWQNDERKPANGRIIARLQQQNVILQSNKNKPAENKTKRALRKIFTLLIDESEGFREKVKAEMQQHQKVRKF